MYKNTFRFNATYIKIILPVICDCIMNTNFYVLLLFRTIQTKKTRRRKRRIILFLRHLTRERISQYYLKMDRSQETTSHDTLPQDNREEPSTTITITPPSEYGNVRMQYAYLNSETRSFDPLPTLIRMTECILIMCAILIFMALGVVMFMIVLRATIPIFDGERPNLLNDIQIQAYDSKLE